MTDVLRRRIVALVAALVLVAGVAARAATAPAAPGAEELLGHVVALTAEEMEGRGSGTPGGERAAQYLALALAAAGLQPGGDGGGFAQAFPLASHSTRPGPDAALSHSGPGGRELALERDWLPHGGSRPGEVAGEVVFVGHGIAASGHDDYRGADVRGKIALAVDGTPAALGAARYSRLDRVIAARRAGATGLLVASDSLPAPSSTGARADLVSAAVTRAAADALLAPSGRSLTALAGAAVPGAVPLGIEVRLRVRLAETPRRAANVIGVLPGSDPALAAQAVVIGAHYDHLGRQRGVVHPGADDNASGTAVVLGLARAFAAAGGAPRTLIFALFAGEEIGLVGSGHYVRHPTVPLDRTVAMVNLDMVGRLRDGRVTVMGVESGRGLRAVVAGAAAEVLPARLHDSPHAPSDHARFYEAGLPVVFFHTGRHADYHRPSDTAERIDAAGMAQVAALAMRVIGELAGGARPAYVSLPPPAGGSRAAVGASGEAFLGVGADGRAESDGVLLRSVVPGSAAARAGLRDGDVLVRIGEAPVDSFEELRTVLRLKRPGDLVRIVFLRDAEDRLTAATLEARP